MTIAQADDARSSLGRNLTHGMVDALGRAIVTGGFADRPFPTEADLALQFNVSRTVTREAVKMLAARTQILAEPAAAVQRIAGRDVMPLIADAESTSK